MGGLVSSDAALRVLLVEDDEDQAFLIRRTLERQRPPLSVTRVDRGERGLAALDEAEYDVVMLDYSLPDLNGLAVLADMRTRRVSAPVVMITGQGDERIAVEAMREGATDYIVKTPGYLTALPTVLHKVLKQYELARENARLYEEAQRALVERQAIQEQLVRGETLRALGELASGAAHHLNNLLTIVSGRAQILLSSTKSAELRRPIEIIDRAARDGAEVVRRIQQFARTAPPDAWELVELNEVAADVVEMMRVHWQDAAQRHGIAITLEKSELPPIFGHAAELREVLTNLLQNAVDAMPQGGHITIRTWCEEDQAYLTMTDTGSGMSPEVLRRAREPFFTTKGPRSTGLGLSVNHGILKRHGGELDLASTEGGGTTVTIRLPVRQASAVVKREPAAPPSTRLRVLVVDDEPEVLATVAEMLSTEGHAVIEAHDGHTALALFDEGVTPDLVLTDLGMPGMNGWEVARHVKRARPQCRVGLLTGWADEVPPPSAGQGAPDFRLGKPLDLDALRRALGACTARNLP